MKTIESLIPGSPAWLQSRSASKAPAMMGVSKYQTRSDLLKQMATGIKEGVDANTQRLFDAGHASEASAREIAEEILCDGLSPVCGESDDGYLTASFDGLTFDGKIGFEHKLWNDKLAAAVRDEIEELPEEYKIQMDQQILVGGLDYVLFMVSDGTRDKCVSMEYRSTPARAAKLLAAWRQFDEDLANYKHVDAAPAIVVAPIEDLPALTVELVGQVTSSNLASFKAAALARIDSINTDLFTDEDFAVAKKTVKFLDDGEKRLVLVKQQALSQTASIDELFRTMDQLREEMKAKRLTLDKLVTARESTVKIEIMQAGREQLSAHLVGLNKRLAKVQMPAIAADFATAIKGKRNLESMRGAVADLVAAKKIEANAIADKIDANLDLYADIAAGYEFLFSDLSGLLIKDADAFEAIVLQRINQHAESERKRLDAERERIRIEEERKANAKAREAAMPKVTEAIDHGDGIKTIVVQHTEPATQPAAQAVTQAIPPASAVVAAIDDGARIRLGEIGDRLGFTVTADFIASLGFHPVETIKAAKMYRESHFKPIVAELIDRLEAVRQRDWRAAA